MHKEEEMLWDQAATQNLKQTQADQVEDSPLYMDHMPWDIMDKKKVNPRLRINNKLEDKTIPASSVAKIHIGTSLIAPS